MSGRAKTDWLKYRRLVWWWFWGKWHARPGVLSPPRTPMQRMKFEREWDTRY